MKRQAPVSPVLLQLTCMINQAETYTRQRVVRVTMALGLLSYMGIWEGEEFLTLRK